MGKHALQYEKKAAFVCFLSVIRKELNYHGTSKQVISVEELLNRRTPEEWIRQLLPELGESFDMTQDPVYQMEGYSSEAPADLSVNLDKYLYGGKVRIKEGTS